MGDTIEPTHEPTPEAEPTPQIEPTAEVGLEPETDATASADREDPSEPVTAADPQPPTPPAAPRPPLPSQMGPRPRPDDAGPRPHAPSDSEKFGRVDDDGNVFVTLPNGDEHFVGQYQAGSPQDGLRMYARRYDDLVVKIELTGKRLTDGHLDPSEASRTVEEIRSALLDPTFVGDLGALADRERQLEQLVELRRETLTAEKEAAKTAAAERREQIVTEAEKLATSHDWRKTGDRFKALVEEWKTIPRFDRSSEQDLWKRFSAARSAFDKARRAHQAALDKQHAAAREKKEKLVAQAQELSSSTDWAATAMALRGLMDQWKAAGFAGKPADDKLWRAFRKAQDAFFAARKATFDARDAEHGQNLQAKVAIVEQAEALLPVKDHAAARKAFRALQGEYAAIGHVPRADKPKLDARMHEVEEAIKRTENDQWRRTDPEKTERAQTMVKLYEKSVADLQQRLDDARATGVDTSGLEGDLASAQQLLDVARKYT
ncbi:MAG: DUF349 domain-containing protein [Candidatus Nanopelagicales bacterium]